jgi:hypothetical protein
LLSEYGCVRQFNSPKPLSRLMAARFANMALFTVWAVDAQEEQQGAHPKSLVHDPPHGIQVIRLRGTVARCCFSGQIF